MAFFSIFEANKRHRFTDHFMVFIKRKYPFLLRQIFLLCESVACFFLLSSPSVSAQNHESDSLQNILKTEKEDTNKVKTLNALGSVFYRTNKYDSSLFYTNKGKELAEKIGYEHGLADAYCTLANTSAYKGNYNGAIDNASKAIALSRKIGYNACLASSLNILGLTYMGQGENPKALTALFEGLTTFKKEGNKKGVCSCLGNIALIYYAEHNNSESLHYDTIALATAMQSGYQQSAAIIEGNIGLLYVEMGNYDKAMAYYNMSLAIDQKLKYSIGLATNYDNIAGIYTRKGDFNQALDYERKSLAIMRKVGKENDIGTIYNTVGDIYYKQKNYPLSRIYHDSALALSKRIGTRGTSADSYLALSQIDSAQNDFKASKEDYKNYIIYRDSLMNEATIKKTTQAEMNYAFALKTDSTKAMQDKLNVVAEEEKQRQEVIRNAFIGGFSLALVASGIFFMQRRKIARDRKLLKESNDIKDKLFSIISHDLRSPLLSIEATIPLLQMEDLPKETGKNLMKNLENSTYSTLNMLDNLLQWSFSQMKGIKIEKVKINLDEVANENLALYRNAAVQKGIKLTGELHSGVVAFADENIVRLVMRNLLNNGIKYTGEGGNVTLTAFNENNFTGFIVSDTGIGIPEDILPTIFALGDRKKMRIGTADEKSSGLGLALCNELIQKLGGGIKIESAEGKGTVCKVSLPANV